MRCIDGDIWEFAGSHVVVIPINGTVGSNGKAVLSRGVGLQASRRDPELRTRLGLLIKEHGCRVLDLGAGIVGFPVEYGMSGFADIGLIKESAEQLADMTADKGWFRVALPMLGCGYGGLSWEEVGPVLAARLDDRFSCIRHRG